MKVRELADSTHFERLNSQQLRDYFLIDNLFAAGTLELIYILADRAIVGSAVPVNKPIELKAEKEMACEYFTDRREVGVINIGSEGVIEVNGKTYNMQHKDLLYIGRESKKIQFLSKSPKKPAKYYIVSYPAHKSYPTTHAKPKDAQTVEIGSDENANKRTISKFIHPDGIKSCQLVMGFTDLAQGSVWNTMPGHTHFRRSEIYMYFNVGPDSLVFHYMGKPSETRHIVVREGQAVLSPAWSIHSGAGLKNYTFVWAMGGENQDFNDMQPFSLNDIK